ncbi:PRC-barrel domain containing protein [Streptomyces sp. MS2.AVA.5]|uniref:PRC-barrel domain containing protein n=1 Tax=Streptomyces achmelvichensis TaxID=3134111 RepID=A0ACC6PP00_9ACTN
MAVNSIWSYSAADGYSTGLSLTGFVVETSDGVVGHVDRQQDDTGVQHLVVDTGVWVFGKSVLIPAGLVTRIDVEAQKVFLGRTRDEIKSAPQFSRDSETGDIAYLSSVGRYYQELDAAQGI